MPIRLARFPARLSKVLKAVVLAGLIGPGLALAACVVPPEVPDDATLDALLGQLTECQRDPAWLSGVGHLMNSHGRFQEAGDHLERALMLAPDMKDAQLDYAIALAGSGEEAAARQLVAQLLADPAMPPHLRAALQRQQATWAAATDWHHRVLLNARVGRDSNLLGSPNLSSLTLTFPGQSVELPLDATYQAQPGLYTRLDVQFELRRDTPGDGHWESFVGLRSRTSPAVNQADLQHTEAGAEYTSYRRSLAGRGYYIGAALSDLDARSGIRYQAQGLAAGLGTARWIAGCEARSGLEVQRRRYVNNDLLSGSYTGLAASMSCDLPSGSQWLLSFKGGQDQAVHAERAGGDQTQYALRLVSVIPAVGPLAAQKGQFWADIELSQSKDSSSYSALLDSGRLRTIQRISARLEYQFPVSPSIQAVAGAEWVQQRSSLPLFANRSWGPYVAFRTAW